MIVEGLVNILVGLVVAMIGALPQGDPLGLGDAPALVGFAQFNSFLPLAEAAAIVGVVLMVQVGVFLFRTVITLWQQLPFT